MCEVKTEIENDAKCQNTEDSSHFEAGKTDISESECPKSDVLNTNQDIKDAETKSDETVETKAVKNGLQVKNSKLNFENFPEFEQVSPLSSFKSSEFSISSIESYDDEIENIIVCVGNEYAYHSYQDPRKNDLCKKNSYNARKSGSYKESVRKHNDTKFVKKKSRSSGVTDKSIRVNERNRSRDNNHTMYKYSPDKIRSSYSCRNYRCSRSWEKSSRNRHTSNRSTRSRSWDKNRRGRESRSPPYESRKRRRRRHSRSRSHSSSFNSPKISRVTRGSSIKKRKLSSNSPSHSVEKLLDRLKSPDNWIINRQKVKPPSPKPPPLPNSPPPPKPPPPVENNTIIPQPPLMVNNVSNAGISPPLWVNQGDQEAQNFSAFQNPSMPSVSVNNLPLVPGLGNLPVHITATGEQILHDMDGRPIPIGPNGHLLPIDMSGRLYPHIVFLYNNQTVPIYMTDDGVLRLPNGEPVPYGLPNQLPINIDGSIIPIGPDSRLLYPCPGIPRQNPFISSQADNPAIQGVDSIATQPNVQRNPLLMAATEVSTNASVKKRLNKTKLSSTIIQIETVSDLELKCRQTLLEIKESKTKTDLEKQLEKNKSEVPAATKTKSTTDFQKFLAETLPKFPAKIPTLNNKVKKKKLYEDIDLKELVEKFSERVSKTNIRAIYQKKVQRMNLPETEDCVGISKTDKKSVAGLGRNANPEKTEEYLKTASDQSSSTFKKDDELSAEEALLEKKFRETIQEAISLFTEIDFKPPVVGRFLFSKSGANFVTEKPRNESPLLKNLNRLPFLSPEDVHGLQSEKKKPVKFRFLPQKDGKLFEKATVPSASLSFAVQCDFTSKRIQDLQNKIERLRRELFRCKNENAELTDLYKSVREENKKKTEELSKVMKKIEEKNKIIRDLSQPRK